VYIRFFLCARGNHLDFHGSRNEIFNRFVVTA